MDMTFAPPRSGVRRFPMSELSPGEEATIEAVNAPNELRLALAELGYSPGETVKKVLQSPLGDPSAYALRGVVTAIRSADARTVTVSVPDGNGEQPWA